ncbi:hypothetical protein AB6805_13550 [Chitinophaga sp. RCC_12]|uniref:hypothetical protein n=1 Tax=Chitinophaga sp. RCC_12 TaxID=3239226 RepID=UPI003525EEAB
MDILPKADYAIFSDTGMEAAATYKYLDFLLTWQQSNGGIPIIVCRDKNLYEDLLRTAEDGHEVSIPAFTANEDGSIGMLRRQCTHKYKIQVTSDYIRDHIYNLPKGSRRPPTAVWMGITTDEMERMAFPSEAWRINTYPLLGYYTTHKGECNHINWGIPMSRQDVVRWLVLHDLPIPTKSACVFCPYKSDAAWAEQREFAPEDFAAAVNIDEAIRDSSHKGIKNPVFLHRSCTPLKEVGFDPRQSQAWGECSGNCHI